MLTYKLNAGIWNFKLNAGMLKTVSLSLTVTYIYIYILHDVP
jgi:hypothetical protein